MAHQHDLSYKYILKKKENFLDLLKKYFDTSWAAELSADDLFLVDKEFVLRDFQEREADIIYRVRFQEEDIYFYCLLELQSTKDNTMPFRLLIYMVELLKHVFENTDPKQRQRQDFRLPAVIPLVVYNGRSPWQVPRHFREYTYQGELFGEYVLDFAYYLLDLNQTPEDFILATNQLIDNVLYWDRDKSDKVEALVILAQRFQSLEPAAQAELMVLLRAWLLENSQNSGKQETVDQLLEAFQRNEVEIMTSGFTMFCEDLRREGMEKGMEKGIEKGMAKGIEKGMAKGMEKGIEKGMERGAKKVALLMLKSGEPLAKVKLYTGLSEKELLALKQGLDSLEQ